MRCFFSLEPFNDYKIDQPLNKKILKDHSHPITKFLLYFHSLEIFLFKSLKICSLKKDESKIMTLGPFSFALSFILTNKKLLKNPSKFFVYRGI